MFLQFDFYPPPVKPELGHSEIHSLRAYVCVCMHVCVVTFLNQALYLIHLCNDIFTKFTENFYGCENMSKIFFTHFKTQHGRHSRLLKNH